MNILIIGGGGREHALAWKVAQSPRAETVFVAPGNAGTARESGVRNVAIDAGDIEALMVFAKENAIGLTIVGPEVPLVAGVVDRFTAAGLRCFGPTQAAAQLEGSKSFSKDFLARHGIPTAHYAVFTDVPAALGYIHAHGAPLVVKADGLAAGKGVILARTEAQAIAAVEDMLSGNVYGSAGHRVVIEEFLEGEEVSFIVMVDGSHTLPLATSQDHKARDDGDTGPNTGGMGAYSPAPVVTPEIHRRIMNEVIRPTVHGMAGEGHPFTGFLYAGLMIAADGTPKVLEFNVRCGDPETQPIMLRLESDLVELCLAALEGRLDDVEVEWDERASIGVVLAAGGYPDDYRKGDVIEGIAVPDDKHCKVFHAGTQVKAGHVVTAGGRVLCVCALGETVAEAQEQAYRCIERIRWPEMYYRRDIGYRAIAREQGEK
jgi:phosphoribosylamine---glycine ligase